MAAEVYCRLHGKKSETVLENALRLGWAIEAGFKFYPTVNPPP